MDVKGAKADGRIARLATSQHGVISINQLRELGVTRDSVRRRVEMGRLHHVHRGVYAVGHTAPSMQREWMAAVLACERGDGGGEPGAGLGGKAEDPAAAIAAGQTTTILGHWGAALSHRSAAGLWTLLPAGKNGPIDVLVPGNGGKRRRRGIRVHRSLTFLPTHVTIRGGIPVTTPARTVADLRRVVSRPGKDGLISARELRRAIRQTEVLGLPLGDDETRDRTRSDLERDFLRLCRRHRLPAPEVNVRIGPQLVDFLWRDRGLVVETDGYRYHRGRASFEDDRARDLDLRGRGFEVIRLSEKQLNHESRQVAEIIRAALRVGHDGRD
jgi:very-short-patch-repair endonuclease